jgi:hypothetical protein
MSRDLQRKGAPRADVGWRSLLRLLVEGSRALEGRLYEGLRVSGYGDVRPAHYAVFRYLEDDGSRVTELAEVAGMTKQSMGELVAYLEERGYIERRPGAMDGQRTPGGADRLARRPDGSLGPAQNITLGLSRRLSPCACIHLL